MIPQSSTLTITPRGHPQACLVAEAGGSAKSGSIATPDTLTTQIVVSTLVGS